MVGVFAVIGPLALDQRDGARQSGAVAVADAAGEVGNGLSARCHRRSLAANS
jgi:hypothetical protein